ncbi:hypothetical protein A5N15_05645 [Rothia kristinae]|uniref:Uncharacterized protein n=1 Tax=Rothia kristinae TaxID=37923 RepID=A0A657IUX5_9MICC|nr:hypothetical protein A5N15_05645 [Rothia kristinae]
MRCLLRIVHNNSRAPTVRSVVEGEAMRKIAAGIVAGLGCAVLALSGCSSQQEDAGQDTGKPTIVATTSVYADIARQVAGDDAQVTAIVDSTSQDPTPMRPPPRTS